MLHGLDPLAVLGADVDDLAVIVVALEAAQGLTARRDEALIRAYSRSIGAETGNRVARAISRMIRALAG